MPRPKKDTITADGKRVSGFAKAYREGGAGGLTAYRIEGVRERLSDVIVGIEGWFHNAGDAAPEKAIGAKIVEVLKKTGAELTGAIAMASTLPASFTGKMPRGRKGLGAVEFKIGCIAEFRKNRLAMAEASGVEARVEITGLKDKFCTFKLSNGETGIGPIAWFRAVEGPANGSTTMEEPKPTEAPKKKSNANQTAERAQALIDSKDRDGLRKLAKKLSVPGYSAMSKDQLAHAIAANELAREGA